MKKKIEIIFALMMALILILPLISLAVEYEANDENDHDVTSFDWTVNPKFPGAMEEPYPDFITSESLQIPSNNPPQQILSKNNAIVDIIQQVDYSLIYDYLYDIVAFGPRVTGSTTSTLASEYIYDTFDSMGLDVNYHYWSYWGHNDRNVEATLHGSDPDSDEIFIVCGHHDSVSGSPGADDNGSGTVATLAAAYILSQYSFNHTIRFVTFSGEEQGLLGSHEYAKDASNNGDNIVGVLNVDMIGYAISQSDGDGIKIYSNSASQWLLSYTQNINQVYSEYFDFTIYPQGAAYNSDHASFWQYGYNAIFYHEYKFNPYYHSPQDTIENMNVTYNAKCTKLIVATLASLAQLSESPSSPDTPMRPIGPINGHIYTDYTFMTMATHPDSDQLFYKWDWGDGQVSNWIGPYNSGEMIEETHFWTEEGTYEIRVKAKDINGAESNWSEPLSLSITRRPILSISISGGLGVKATISNIADVNLPDLSWSISFERGLILVSEGTEGTIDNIAPGDSIEIQTDKLVGIGFPKITISVNQFEKTVQGLMLGPFVLIFS
ncbi:MAG: M28 family peptidase [Thermoplasmatota archaeon]